MRWGINYNGYLELKQKNGVIHTVYKSLPSQVVGDIEIFIDPNKETVQMRLVDRSNFKKVDFKPTIEIEREECKYFLLPFDKQYGGGGSGREYRKPGYITYEVKEVPGFFGSSKVLRAYNNYTKEYVEVPLPRVDGKYAVDISPDGEHYVTIDGVIDKRSDKLFSYFTYR